MAGTSLGELVYTLTLNDAGFEGQLAANKAQMKESDVHETLEADDLIFYHSIRADLDLLKKKPKLKGQS